MSSITKYTVFDEPVEYADENIERTKCRILIDKKQEQLLGNVFNGNVPLNFLDERYTEFHVQQSLMSPLFDTFKTKFQAHLEDSKLNHITGFDSFNRVDICLGCTQYLDSLHISHTRIQVLHGEYSYHEKIKKELLIVDEGSLVPNIPLIVSIPFARIGKVYPNFNLLLDKCNSLNIDVHLDGAWITAARNIDIDLSHTAIKSFAVSMSKGYALGGWNRIGLRWTKQDTQDIITVMNDYNQIHSMSVAIGNYFLDNIEPDHLWNSHGIKHEQVCRDFNLNISDTIHMATDSQHNVVGIAPLIRNLENV
jgi:hypothetical protein